MKTIIRTVLAVTATAAVIYAVDFLATDKTPSQEEMDRREYCEMIKIYADTEGKFGWPPYNRGTVDCDDIKTTDTVTE